MNRFSVLDGWRGISILAVLACHLLPLGPKSLMLNEMAGPVGMSLFFTLSGFLITQFLLTHDSVLDFLSRRFFRIAPLGWLACLVAVVWSNSPPEAYVSHFLFVANRMQGHLTEVGSHLWSLCVEVQFYATIALVFAAGGRRALYLVVPACLAITANRVVHHAYVNIDTFLRVDEILAGAILALAHADKLGKWPARLLSSVNCYVLLALLLVCSHPASGPMNYLRPYVAAMLVGATLYAPPQAFARILNSRVLFYIATISFALYVVHHFLAYLPIFNSDNKTLKYAMRPVLFGVSFLLAHLSTFYFERPLIEFGKKLSIGRARVHP